MQGSNNVLLVHKLPALALHVDHWLIRNARIIRRRLTILGWNAEVLELFTKNKHDLLGDERFLARDKVCGGGLSTRFC